MCSEAMARKAIGAEGASTLVGIIEGGWQAYLDEGRARNPRTRANIVWDAMVERADAELASMTGVERTEVFTIPVYVLRDKLALRFKKHNADLLTSNVSTGFQARLASQGSFDMLPGLAHVTCGYVLDKTETEVSQCVVVRRVAGDIDWAIDLRELAGGTLRPTTPILPRLGDDDAVAHLPSIASRRKRRPDGRP